MDSQIIELVFEPIPGDTNDDGYVNVIDLLVVIGDWGCTSACVGDVDGDGTVSVNDLLVVIANWGG
jgi:hypothetical protein